MGKFRQLSQELWPLIDVRNLFLSLSLPCFCQFSSNLKDFFQLGYGP